MLEGRELDGIMEHLTAPVLPVDVSTAPANAAATALPLPYERMLAHYQVPCACRLHMNPPHLPRTRDEWRQMERVQALRWLPSPDCAGPLPCAGCRPAVAIGSIRRLITLAPSVVGCRREKVLGRPEASRKILDWSSSSSSRALPIHPSACLLTIFNASFFIPCNEFRPPLGSCSYPHTNTHPRFPSPRAHSLSRDPFKVPTS